ncbi:hypothetical protein ABIB40_002132 [Pedobacter sp. UYP30]|uniref:hypothetical protein n=1 Tax=Pedobacter sp. UYP30 TaxID=1756400 RepID=UPI0033995B4A
MKRIALFVLIFMTINLLSCAQSKSDLVGSYNIRPKADGEIASSMHLFENHKYVVTFYTGGQVGNWAIDNNDRVTFTPTGMPKPFTIFGRQNKYLADSTRIMFSGFQGYENYIGTQKLANNKPLMKQVLNRDANCAPFPIVYTFKGDHEALSFFNKPFQDEENQDKNVVYNFKNEQNYNDFIAVYTKSTNDERPYFAMAKNGGLFFEGTIFAKKEPLLKDVENAQLLRKSIEHNFNPADIYYNPFYGAEAKDIKDDTSNYIFDVKKNAYLDKLNYVAGEELKPDDNSFNSKNIYYRFEALKTVTESKVPSQLNHQPIFNYKCDN